jgi:hypothetical protein
VRLITAGLIITVCMPLLVAAAPLPLEAQMNLRSCDMGVRLPRGIRVAARRFSPFMRAAFNASTMHPWTISARNFGRAASTGC